MARHRTRDRFYQGKDRRDMRRNQTKQKRMKRKPAAYGVKIDNRENQWFPDRVSSRTNYKQDRKWARKQPTKALKNIIEGIDRRDKSRGRMTAAKDDMIRRRDEHSSAYFGSAKWAWHRNDPGYDSTKQDVIDATKQERRRKQRERRDRIERRDAEDTRDYFV